MIVKDLSNSFHPVPKDKRIVNHKLIDEKKHDCEYCGKKNCYTNTHHIKSKGSGGNDTKDNLIELCGDCHRKVHDGIIAKEELLKIIKRRKRNGRLDKNT